MSKAMQPVAGRKQLCHPACWKRRAVLVEARTKRSREARMLWGSELEMAKKEPTSFRERAPTSDFGNVSIAVF
jgi:hypothetical protein